MALQGCGNSQLAEELAEAHRLQPGAAGAIHLEAVGTHGLLELDARPATGAVGQQQQQLAARQGCYQLGVSINSCPGVFGRSKMLTVHPRVLLWSLLPLALCGALDGLLG